ncbi:MAG: hypothetical protein IPI00_18180 [Flavobacteriales bacterium]|nr:hypothetical protein [Flavobacteriales bacterium]MBK6944427.1 hypothetical protein [Flavobacteriales bacterium]MBK7242028.1 hypothetical protein [Flavobacteriales bacterium]MBK7298083.1 hypothetical protein [Flavobacteriales bacterium]MBK9534096.1 hypothetical protein [Flavobacteriales bacterium]
MDFLNSHTRVQQAARVQTNVQVGVSAVTNRYVMTNTPTMEALGRNGIRCGGTIDPNSSTTFY